MRKPKTFFGVILKRTVSEILAGAVAVGMMFAGVALITFWAVTWTEIIMSLLMIVAAVFAEYAGFKRGVRSATAYDVEDTVYYRIYNSMMEDADYYNQYDDAESQDKYRRCLMAAARITSDYDVILWDRQQRVDPNNKVMVLDVLRQRRHKEKLTESN